MARINEIVNGTVVNSLPAIMSETQALRPTNDSVRYDNIAEKVADLFVAVRNQVGQKIPDYEIKQIAQNQAHQIEQFSRKQVTAMVKRFLGVDVFQAEPWLAQEMEIFVTENVSLIKSNNAAFIADVERTVMDGMRRGLRHEAIAKQINGKGKDELGRVSRFKNSKTRANLIGRDQVNKFNAKLNELRQKNLGVKRYIWRTNVDGRERASHRAWNGMEFTWAEGSPIGTHPGEEIQCRCYPEPVLDDLLND